jgi:micrococcal nuclease
VQAMRKFFKVLLTIVFILTFSFEIYATGGNITGYGEKLEVKFVETVDGDTADFELNSQVIRVRFLGINTRETVAPNKPVEAWGKAASDFTNSALKNANKIEIEYDKNASKKDKYDRHLTWIWVDGKLLQEELVLQGLAEQYMLQTNYRYADVLQEAESIAKLKKIGIWSENEYIENNENATQNSTNTKENKLDIDNKTLIFIAILIIGIIAITIKKVNSKN